MDNTKPLISVIIPVYNTKNYLEKCLDSVLNQTYENLEVIIVDDGSTDGSEAMCDEYAQRDSRVKVIHKENGGQCTARNVGLDMATGDYFAFVDSDDWIDERMYETLMTNALKYGCDLSTCVNTDTKNPDGRLEIVEQPEIMKAHLLGQKGVCQSPCNKIFKRELFDGIRFFKMRAYEDCATLHFVLARANKAVFQNEIMYYYVKRENSTMTQSFSPVKFKSIEAYRIMLDHYEEKFPQYACLAKEMLLGTIQFCIGEARRSKERKKFAEHIKMARTVAKSIKTKGMRIKHRFSLFLIKHSLTLFGWLYRISR